MTVVLDTREAELSRDDFGAGELGHVLLPGGGLMVPHKLKVTRDIAATIYEEEAA